MLKYMVHIGTTVFEGLKKALKTTTVGDIHNLRTCGYNISRYKLHKIGYNN
jgi:hypothetical protein